MLPLAAHPLVHVNASLNSLATVLLVVGFLLIKQRKETAHKRVMLSAFAVSILFLGCYLYYHSLQLTTSYNATGVLWYFYYCFLLPTHVILAMAVPVLALITILFGLRAHGEWLPSKFSDASDIERQEYMTRSRTTHRRWARITYPIWLYVSITGVVVYAMLYHFNPPPDAG